MCFLAGLEVSETYILCEFVGWQLCACFGVSSWSGEWSFYWFQSALEIVIVMRSLHLLKAESFVLILGGDFRTPHDSLLMAGHGRHICKR